MRSTNGCGTLGGASLVTNDCLGGLSVFETEVSLWQMAVMQEGARPGYVTLPP